jgi:hypothetical protein
MLRVWLGAARSTSKLDGQALAHKGGAICSSQSENRRAGGPDDVELSGGETYGRLVTGKSQHFGGSRLKGSGYTYRELRLGHPWRPRTR